jgi:hypothetical protein
MKEFTQDGMFNELSKVTRALNKSKYEKMDLPRYGNGGEDPVTNSQVDSDKYYLMRMANSPLFVERYARMVGKPIDQVAEEAEAYRKEILNNIETVKVNDIGVLPKGVNRRDTWDMDAVYYEPLKKEDIEEVQKTINESPKYLRKSLEEQLNKEIANHPNHQLFLYGDDPWLKTHELSHASVKGNINSKNVNTYSFGDVFDTPRLRRYYKNREEYLTSPDEQKARVDVARKYLESKGLYDPVNEPFTEKHYDMLKKELNEKALDPDKKMPDDIEEISLPYDKETTIKMFNDFVFNDQKKDITQARLGGLTKFVDGGPNNSLYTFEGRPDSVYKKGANGQWQIKNTSTNGEFITINDPTGSRAKILNAKAIPVPRTQNTIPDFNNALLTRGMSPQEYYVQQNQFSPEIAKSQQAAVYKSQIEQEKLRQQKEKEKQNYLASIPKGPVSDNTRTVIPDIAVQAMINKPGADAAKEKQKEFEKELWKNYEKLSTTDKALDRTKAFMVDPFGMTARFLTGDQAYYPGMGEGLLNHDSENYGKYLRAAGYTPGTFEAFDVGNMINPMYWGASIGNNMNKGNYGTAGLEAGLTLLPFMPKNTGSLVKDGGKMLVDDFVRIGEAVKNNTWKINPNAYQYNIPENVMFRGIGEEGMIDAIESGVFRPRQPQKTDDVFSIAKDFDKAYYSPDFSVANRYGNGYIAEVPSTAATFRNRYPGKTWSQHTVDQIPVDQGKILKKHWWDGYKPVEYNPMSNEAPLASAIDDTKKVIDNNDGIELFQRNPDKAYTRPAYSEEVEKFKLENPDKVKSVIHENWNNNADVIFNRDAQKEAFDKATEFSNKWLFTDSKAYDDITNAIKELRENKRTFKPTPDEQVVIDKILTTKNDIRKRVFDDFGLDNNTYFSKIGSGNTDDIEFIKKVDEEIANYENHVFGSTPNYRKLKQDYDAVISRKDSIDQNIMDLEKETDNLIDPEFKRKVDDLHAMSKLENLKNYDKNYFKWYEKRDPVLVHMNEGDQSFKNLPDYDKEYLRENFNNVGGVRTRNNTITLASRPDEKMFLFEQARPDIVEKTITLPKKEAKLTKPSTWKNIFDKDKTITQYEYSYPDSEDRILYEIDKQNMVNPQTVGEINAHEIGHDMQNVNNWANLIQHWDPAYGYSTNHGKTVLSRRYKDAMVEPITIAENNGIKSYETWKSGIGELHSELMSARFKAVNHYMDEGYSMDEAIKLLKTYEKEGNEELFDYYLGVGDLNKHFKPQTTVAEKRELLKYLPAVVGTAGAVKAASDSGISPLPQQQRFGGNISNLQKFIR